MVKTVIPKRVTIVMMGPHGSGKTTLGRMLARRLRFHYHDEIGKLLRQAVLLERPDQTAEKPQPDFDIEVFRQEMNRDHEPVAGRIVETWHPGNLSFAAARNPEIAGNYRSVLERHIRGLNDVIAIQPLEISSDSARMRLSEPAADADCMVAFFQKVYRVAMTFAFDWRLQVLPAVRTDRVGIEEACCLIEGILRMNVLSLYPHADQSQGNDSFKQARILTPAII